MFFVCIILGMNEKIVEWLESSTALIKDEIPSFIQEAALYGFWFNLVLVIIFISIVIFLYFLSKSCKEEIRKEKNEDAKDSLMNVIYFCIIAGISFLFIALIPLTKATKALIFPRLYVVERVLRN